MGFLTGGSRSSSGNQAYGFLRDQFSPFISTGAGANNAIAALLGVGGDPAAQQNAFNTFRNSTGYQFQLDQGNNAITSSAAARGLLNSGSALKAREKYGQGLASNYFSQYLNQLGGLTQNSLAAGNLIGGAGATSSSKSSPGLGGIIGGAIGAAFSDERLKKNMKHWATDENGIRYYEWEWNDRAEKELGLKGKAVGVSAQELRGTKHERAVMKSEEGYDKVAYALLPDPLKKAA